MTTHQLSIGSGLKFSTLFLSIFIASSSLYAAENTTSSVNTVTKKVVEKAAEEKKTEKAPTTVPFTGQSNNNLFPLQTHSVRQGAGRFGENRNGRSHGGVDINYATANKKNEKMVAINDGKVTFRGGTMNALVITLDNGDQIAYLHNQSNLVKVGQRVTRGQDVAIMGNSGTGPVHLHFSYAVPNKRAFAHHLKSDNVANSYKGSSSLKALINNGHDYTSKQMSLTNPAPYLPEDVLFVFGNAADQAMNPYLGNTMRTQWNALYSGVTGTTLQVPSCIQTRGGCTKVIHGKKFPKVALAGGQVGNMDAYAAANTAIAQGMADGSIPAEMANQDYVSPADLSRYMTPRTIFGGNAEEVALDTGDFNLSPSEQITKLGLSRFGNEGWAKNLSAMSMRGMLTEYLNMTTANNYLTKEQYRQQERIEALMAAYVAQRAQRFSGYVDRAYAATEEARVNAAVSDMPLERLFTEDFDYTTVTDSEDFSQILASAKGEVPRVCKGGIAQHRKLQQYPDLLPEIERVALKFGFNPNDLAAVIGFESGGFNPRGMNPNASATGLMQWTRMGIADISQSLFQKVGLYPKYAPSKNKKGHWGFGTTTESHRNTILSMSVTEQMSLGEAYLTVKVAQNRRWRNEYGNIALKDIRHLYPLVLGSATYVSPSEQYRINRGMDTNGDGKITPAEAATSPKFYPYLCQYFPKYP
ncbi:MULTISPECIES: M23 family metallopeptidase [Acinetobacter]|uniref:M23 family metallopeptidase n=1 Tax=Acinetobacter indicus TaxID=756892 RepID=A0A6C0Y6C4_9GAMM|nr:MULTISPECIES: M23 family metallopeptidase [Acinetobacter]QIC71683.1 M23 family metallopeptidase [Acinetobacter indicus]QKQ71592.1 M23 family metallopeptidase [Acinetobacter sp. 10FS3-1]